MAEKYLEENQEYLAANLNRIHQVGEIIPSEVKVEHVWVADLPGMEIQFDIALSVEYEATERDYHYDNSDGDGMWLMVRCQGSLDNDLDDFEVFEVSEFCNKNRVENPMDDELVPVIHSEKLDAVAEDFLRKHYKKALLQPTWVDPMKLATSMGLSVKFVYITKEKSIFGRSYFFDSDAELYDPETDSFYVEHIPAGTNLS